MIKRVFALIMALALAFSFSGCERKIKALDEYRNENPEITGILSVKDGYIVDETGKHILLKGINLGNWMLMETWMSAVPEYTEDWAYYDTLEVLNERFGAEKSAELIRIYEENYITEADIAQIEKLGFNCVRVPFWYRNFMNEDGTWLTENAEDNPGFQRLDWLIEQCGKHGIYVILDLHGAPGGQSMNHCCGKAERNLLYTEEANMEAAERLWKTIAARYSENPVVAAYDLLNEPQNNGGYAGDTAWAAESEEAVSHTNEAYDRLYWAVRAEDDAHMISLEGVWSTTVLPDPEEMGYKNMLYQLHLYDTDRGMIRYRVKELKTARKNWNAAVIVGEYNNMAEEAYACRKYEKNEISYMKWTYKTLNTGDNWGIFNGNVGRIDIKTASYDEIKDFFANSLHTENFDFNAEEMDAITP